MKKETKKEIEEALMSLILTFTGMFYFAAGLSLMLVAGAFWYHTLLENIVLTSKGGVVLLFCVLGAVGSMLYGQMYFIFAVRKK